MNFIKLTSDILANKELNANQKLILAYIQSYQLNDKDCYSKLSEMAETLGMPIATVKRNVNALESKGIIKRGLIKDILNTTKPQYKNRKATVYVGLNGVENEAEISPAENEPTPAINSDFFIDEIFNEEIDYQKNMNELDKIMAEFNITTEEPKEEKSDEEKYDITTLYNQLGDELEDDENFSIYRDIQNTLGVEITKTDLIDYLTNCNHNNLDKIKNRLNKIELKQVA